MCSARRGKKPSQKLQIATSHWNSWRLFLVNRRLALSYPKGGWWTYTSGFQSVVPGATASSSPGNLAETERQAPILADLCVRHPGRAQQCFNKPSSWYRGKESACQCRRPRFDPWVGKTPGEGNGSPLQYSCPGKSHGQRSLAGYSPWGHKESETTERLKNNTLGDSSQSREPLVFADRNGFLEWIAPSDWGEGSTPFRVIF